jgi:DNA-binding transcriptional regulator YiaG
MATLEQVFQREKAWILACEDVDALIEKIGDYREDVRVAERDGHMLLRLRAGDLIELARSRVVRLQAREIGAERAERPTPVTPAAAAPAPKRAQAERPKPTGASVARSAADRPRAGSPAEAASTTADKAKADARLAAAEPERVEIQNALLKAHLEAAPRAGPAAASNAAQVVLVERARPVAATVAAATTNRVAAPTTAKRASTKPAEVRATAASRAPKCAPAPKALPDDYSEADRLALASVGRWPPVPADRRSAFWTRDADWPPEWTLTGGDLGRFRGELNVTRAVFAAQLGVASAVIKDAELRPREKVGPALQIALRKAMEVVGERRRRVREERRERAEAAPPASAPVRALPSPPVAPQQAAPAPTAPEPPQPVEASSSLTPLTGADLARTRNERGLSQRQLAERLGMGHGMVAKAEAAAWKPLAPRMQAAVAAFLREGVRYRVGSATGYHATAR